MNTFEINSWIENNIINYNKINDIVKQYPDGITTKKLVTIYNLKEETKYEELLTIETFNHIVKTTQRYHNTFYNILNINYNEETNKWVTINENYIEEINRLKKEKKKLKEAMDNIAAED